MNLPTEADLTPAEQRLCKEAAEGQLLDLTSGRLEDDEPARGWKWKADRQIRSQLLYQLLTGRGDLDTVFGPALAVRVQGAGIIGSLHFGALTLRCPLELCQCHLGNDVELTKTDVELTKTKAPDLNLSGSHLTGALRAYHLRLEHELNLNGSICQGGVRLSGAKIDGQLDCPGGGCPGSRRS